MVVYNIFISIYNLFNVVYNLFTSVKYKEKKIRLRSYRQIK